MKKTSEQHHGHPDVSFESLDEVAERVHAFYPEVPEPRLAKNAPERYQMAIEMLADIYGLPKQAIVPEMFDFLKVVKNGTKHGLMNWLLPDGATMEDYRNLRSIDGHIYQGFYEDNHIDKDSGLDSLLHAQTRLMMKYVRRSRGIVHPDNVGLQFDGDSQ